MDYFKPMMKYYVVPIIQKDNSKLLVNNKNLSSYITETFPILDELREEGMRLYYNFDRSKTVKNEQYLRHCQDVENILKYLNLPQYLLFIGNDFAALEMVTANIITGENNNQYELTKKRVSDMDWEDYHIEDYAYKVNNFFNPSIDTFKKAHLSKEVIMKKINRKEKVKTLFLKKKGRK